MSSLARLRKPTVESGREHPFVEALLAELYHRKEEMIAVMVANGNARDPAGHGLLTMGARLYEVDQVIQMIERTEGVDE